MNTFRITTITLATAALLASCNEYELTYDGTQMSLPEGVFDYSLTSVNNVNIDLGEYGRQTHLEFFTEDPSKNRSALPIYSIFTDNEGRFSADVNLPNGYDKIYLHTRTEFVPHVVALDVKNGTISYTFNGDGTTRAMAATRAAERERTIYLTGCSAGSMYVYLYQEGAGNLMSWDDAISNNYKMNSDGGGNWHYTIPSSFSSADKLIFRCTDNGGWKAPENGGYTIVEDGIYTTSGLQSIKGISTKGWYADDVAAGSGSNSIYNLKADDSDKESDDFNIYSLCKWDLSNYYGKVNTPSDYFGKSDITATQWNDLKKRIRKAFWGDENAHTRPAVTYFKKGASKDNSGKAVDTNHLNITIASTTKVDGQEVPVDNAEVYFTFLTENGWNQNTIGYYYYTGNAPTDPTAVKRFIILPNASIANDWDENNDENLDRLNMPYVLSDSKPEGYYDNRNEWSYHRSNAPVAENKKIKLLYWNNGEPSTKFPAGTTIGFFIISNGFGNAYNQNHNKGLNLYRSEQGSKGYLYSNKEWNKIGNGNYYDFDGDLSNVGESSVAEGGARFATLNDKLGVVVGVEDGTDCSFEDDVFLISSNVHGVLEDPDRPDLEYPKSDTKTGTLLYEDIWAGGGDYDMNDVVVNYTRTINYNEDNSVNYIEDVFVPYVGLDKYADYEDGFGYVVAYAPGTSGITTTMLKNGEETSDVYYEAGSKSIILFKDQHAVEGSTYTIKRVFTGTNKPQKTAIEADEFNGVKWDPFIISKGDENGYAENRIEIHIPGRPATSYAQSVDAITNHFFTNFIDSEKGFPFSLNLPISNFEVSPEGVIITDTYPQFAKWVNAGNVETDYTVKWNNPWALWYNHKGEE